MSYFRSGDPDADFARLERELEEWLKTRTKCDHCGEYIQDERFLRIEGGCYHFKCADEAFGEDTENFAV